MAYEKMNPDDARPNKKPTETETYKDRSTSMGEYREGNMEYMKGMYPDMEMNDENYDEMLNKTMHGMIPKMKSFEENNMKIKAMMEDEPKLASILADMAQGAKFEMILPKYIDVKNMELMPGDPDYNEWEANNKYRMDNYQKSMDRKQMLENNQMKSMEVINSWFEEKKMEDDKKKEYGMFVADLLDRGYSGEITPEFLNKMYYAMNYEKDMAMAEEAGEVRGKNEKITMMKKEEKEMMDGDGLPNVEGGGSKEKEMKPDNSNPLEKSLKKMTMRKSVLPGNGY